MPVLPRVTQFDRQYVVDLENDFNSPELAFICSLISPQMEVAGCFGTTQIKHTIENSIKVKSVLQRSNTFEY